MKKFEILQELQNVTQRHKVSKCCWQKGTNRLAWHRVATNPQLLQKIYLRRTIKKQGMPVFLKTSLYF